MAGADEGSRIRDAIRDSKIRWDIPLKSDLMLDSVEPEPSRYSTGLRHTLYKDAQLVDGDLPRVAMAEVGAYCHHQKSSLRERNRSWFRSFLPILDGSPIFEELWEWIDSIEDYFEETQAPERLKCKLASYTLEGEAESWWLRLQRDRVEEGKLKIYSWTKMKRLLAMEFLHHRCSRKVSTEDKGIYIHSEKPKRCYTTEITPSQRPSSVTTAKQKGHTGDISYGASDGEERMNGFEYDAEGLNNNDGRAKEEIDKFTPNKSSIELPFEPYVNKQDGENDLRPCGIFGLNHEGNDIEISKKYTPINTLNVESECEQVLSDSNMFGRDEKQPKLSMNADENSGGFPAMNNNGGNCHVNPETERQMQVSGLIAGLMVLESLPAMQKDKLKKAVSEKHVDKNAVLEGEGVPIVTRTRKTFSNFYLQS